MQYLTRLLLLLVATMRKVQGMCQTQGLLYIMTGLSTRKRKYMVRVRDHRE